MILPDSFSFNKNKGFTLIELLVVIAILGILATLGFASFQRAQLNARDAKRIQATDQVKIALELYFDTNLEYPTSNPLGELQCESPIKTILWGNEFECDGQIYMKTLPESPGTIEYCYVAAGTPPSSYNLYAQMENDNNANLSPEVTCNSEDYDYEQVSEV